MLPLPPYASKPFDVVGVGEASLDVVGVVDAWPGPDEKHCLDALELSPGGQTATAVAACARLGWRARFHGFLGEDEWGEEVEVALARAQVDVVPIRRAGVRTRGAVVLVERRTGRRTILAHRDPSLTLTTRDLRLDVVTSGRVLLVDASDLELSIAAARAAREAGIPTVCDVDAVKPGVDALLSHIDVVVTSAQVPRTLTGESTDESALRALAGQFKAAMIAVTLGPDGSLALAGDQLIRTSAPKIDAVDSTGAGDAFRGGLIAAWLESDGGGRPEDLLAFANAVAAVSCTVRGAMAALPDCAAVSRVTGGAAGQSK